MKSGFDKNWIFTTMCFLLSFTLRVVLVFWGGFFFFLVFFGFFFFFSFVFFLALCFSCFYMFILHVLLLSFSLPLGVGGWRRTVIVALPGLLI